MMEPQFGHYHVQEEQSQKDTILWTWQEEVTPMKHVFTNILKGMLSRFVLSANPIFVLKLHFQLIN